jgi:2-succinyl-6-hydroxy-2,4-cyclohexadiene-1-carboxylate synthase
LAGHHRGPPPPPSFIAEVDRLAAHIAALVRASGGPVQLAGYSLGGRLALALAARYGHLFARVVTIGAHPGLADGDAAARAERAAADRRWATLLVDEGLAAFTAAWAAQPLFASQAVVAAEKRAAQATWRQSHEPGALAETLTALSVATMPDLAPALAARPAGAAPLLLLAGDEDQKFAALAHGLAARVGGARAVIVDGAGHNLVLERPAAVAEVLTAPLALPAQASPALDSSARSQP